MPKVNVYLPDDMAEEVRAANLSLSPVCQRAIRKELAEMKIKQQATSDLEAVAARLNGTIHEEGAETYQEGRDYGILWAREWATASELRQMAEAPGTGPEFQEGSSLLAFMESRADMNIDWSRHGGARWRGFIDGAREVLEAVGLLLKA